MVEIIWITTDMARASLFPPPPATERKRRQAPRKPDDDEKPGYGFFDLSLYNRGFDVPWDGKTTAFGMFGKWTSRCEEVHGLPRGIMSRPLAAGWFISFVLVGLVALPLISSAAGEPLGRMSPQEKAVYIGINQVLPFWPCSADPALTAGMQIRCGRMAVTNVWLSAPPPPACP